MDLFFFVFAGFFFIIYVICLRTLSITSDALIQCISLLKKINFSDTGMPMRPGFPGMQMPGQQPPGGPGQRQPFGRMPMEGVPGQPRFPRGFPGNQQQRFPGTRYIAQRPNLIHAS